MRDARLRPVDPACEPIISAINANKLAWKIFEMRINDYGAVELGGADSSLAEEATDSASDAAMAAAWKLTDTPVDTVRGAAALM